MGVGARSTEHEVYNVQLSVTVIGRALALGVTAVLSENRPRRLSRAFELVTARRHTMRGELKRSPDISRAMCRSLVGPQRNETLYGTLECLRGVWCVLLVRRSIILYNPHTVRPLEIRASYRNKKAGRRGRSAPRVVLP